MTALARWLRARKIARLVAREEALIAERHSWPERVNAVADQLWKARAEFDAACGGQELNLRAGP